MPNQRDIARVLKLNQATISLALRGDLSISEKTRRKVRQTAEKMGYRPNAYVSSLMAHIRAGRCPSDEGVIAVLVDAKSLTDWHRLEAYRLFHKGIHRRASELGFRAEFFFLRAPGMNAAAIDRILEARGIQSLVLAPPYRGNRSLSFRWERYASLGMGHGWEPQQLDRLATDHTQNILTAFSTLGELGYQRIGVLLDGMAATGGRGLRWKVGYLEAQDVLPASRRIPIFQGGNERETPAKLKRWLRLHQPEVLLTLTGREISWLEALKIRVPDDMAMACLARPQGGFFAGIDEKNEIMGAAAVDLVVARLSRNEYGLPGHPCLTLIDGRWKEGISAPPR